MLAQNNGTLRLTASSISNKGGIINAFGGAVVEYRTVINGGTLGGRTGSHVVTGSTTFNGITQTAEALYANASTTFSGTNTLSGSTADLYNNSTVTLSNATIQGTGRITNNSGRTIAGHGTIRTGNLTNNGTIRASTGHLTLDASNAYINNGTLQADGGRTLRLLNNTFDNRIVSDPNHFASINATGTVEYAGATVIGGELKGSGTHKATSASSFQGNIISANTLEVASTAAGTTIQDATFNTDFQARASTTFRGTNTFTNAADDMKNSGTVVLEGATLKGAGRVLNDAGKTLSGHGTISLATISNTGTLRASTGTMTLAPTDAIVNRGVLQADSGRTLILTGTVDNRNAAIQANGNVQYNGVDLQGGTLNGGGTHQVTGSSELVIDNNSNVSLAGTITGTGKITNNSGSSLFGSGTINTSNLANNGTLQATTGTLVVDPGANAYVNNGIMRAQTGVNNILRLEDGTINNGGSIDARNIVEYNGTTIQNGTLTGTGTHRVLHPHGASFSGVTVDTNANIEALAGVEFLGSTTFKSGSDLTINSHTLINRGTLALQDANLSGLKLTNVSGTTTSGYGNISLKDVDNQGTITANANGQTLTVSTTGGISNSGTLRADNGGILELKAVVGNSSDIIAGTSSQVRYNGATINSQTLEGAGTHRVTGTSSFNGISMEEGSLIVDANQTLNVDATSTFNPATLLVNGQLNSAANMTIDGDQNQILTGSGTVGGSGTLTITNSGIISPGESPGTMNVGNTIFDADGVFLLEVNNFTGTEGADAGWDLLAVAGTLNITAPSNDPFVIDLDSLTLANVSGNAVNFDDLSNFTLTFVTTTGGITGFAANLFSIDTSDFTNPFTGSFRVAQLGDNLALQYTAVPEPSSFAILGMVSLGLFGYRRLRQRKAKRTLS